MISFEIILANGLVANLISPELILNKGAVQNIASLLF